MIVSAFASATRILHPPDMSLVARFIISVENPRPCRMAPALDSNVEGSSSSSSSSLSWSAISSITSADIISSYSRSRRSALSLADCTIKSSAFMSEGSASP